MSDRPSAFPRQPTVRVSSRPQPIPADDPRSAESRRARRAKGNTLTGMAPAPIPPPPPVPPELEEAESAPVSSHPPAMAPEPPAPSSSKPEPPLASEPERAAAPPEAAPPEPEQASAPPDDTPEERGEPESDAQAAAAPPEAAPPESPRPEPAAASAPSRGGRWPVYVLGAAVGAAGIWLLRPSEESAPPAPAEVTKPSTAAPAAAEPPPKTDVPASAPAASAAPPVADEPAPTAEETAAPADDSEAAAIDERAGTESIRVVVKTEPRGARFYRVGKEVAETELVVDLEPGEKRAYEVAHPGYVTRKLVVDGSQTEILFGLRRQREPE